MTNLKELIQQAKNGEISWDTKVKLTSKIIINKSLKNISSENWNKIRHTAPGWEWKKESFSSGKNLREQIAESNKLLNSDWKFANETILSEFKKHVDAERKLMTKNRGEVKINEINENDVVTTEWKSIIDMLGNDQKIFGRNGDGDAYRSESALLFLKSIIDNKFQETIEYQENEFFFLQEWKNDEENSLDVEVETLTLWDIVKQKGNIEGKIIAVNDFSTRFNPHCAMVINIDMSSIKRVAEGGITGLPFLPTAFITLHELHLAIYDSAYKKLPEELSIQKISGMLTWKDADKRHWEIRNRLTSGEFNHLYYKELMKANRNFTISAQADPDDYLRPFDIVERQIIEGDIRDVIPKWHFAIYLGNKKVCNISREDGATKRDREKGLQVRINDWKNFLHGQPEAICHHPFALFKDHRLIIKHLKKCLENDYGKGEYNLLTKNCEHFTNLIIYGFPSSEQIDKWWDIASKLAGTASIPALLAMAEEEKKKALLLWGKIVFESLEKKRDLTLEEQQIFNELETRLEAQIEIPPRGNN